MIITCVVTQEWGAIMAEDMEVAYLDEGKKIANKDGR